MDTTIDEIADGIYRLSTYDPRVAPPAGLTYNVFLILGDDPLLFHTGKRSMFPAVSAAIARVLPLDQLRWIAFGHYEADECGAMNEFLAAAPRAAVAHGQTACRGISQRYGRPDTSRARRRRSHRPRRRQACALP